MEKCAIDAWALVILQNSDSRLPRTASGIRHREPSYRSADLGAHGKLLAHTPLQRRVLAAHFGTFGGGALHRPMHRPRCPTCFAVVLYKCMRMHMHMCACGRACACARHAHAHMCMHMHMHMSHVTCTCTCTCAGESFLLAISDLHFLLFLSNLLDMSTDMPILCSKVHRATPTTARSMHCTPAAQLGDRADLCSVVNAPRSGGRARHFRPRRISNDGTAAQVEREGKRAKRPTEPLSGPIPCSLCQINCYAGME